MSNIDTKCVNAIRVLAADAIQKAKSGHPGLPLGSAPMAYELWANHMNHNAKDPKWANRDRFILSGGHGSTLLYSLLHFYGYGLTMDDMKEFRQMGSLTPGHPEYGHTVGVEATTGPLGAGMGMAVGMAMAEAHLASMFNRPGYPVVDHYTFALGVQAAQTGRQRAESGVRRVSKLRQKKQIQRQYVAAQTGRQAEGIVVQGAGEAVFTPVQRTERKIEGFIRKNRGKLVILFLAVMMTYMLSSLSGCMPIAQSLLESLVIGTYPAEEDDLIAAERAYCEMEDALQDELDRYGEIHPGYDEVQVEQIEIWHDPYVLLALISARIGGEWTVDTAMPTLELLFEQQYKLTTAVEKETRYRTEWKKEYEQVEDPKTGEMKWRENWVQIEVICTQNSGHMKN